MAITPENTKPWLITMIKATQIVACKYCQEPIVWLTSPRNRNYPVNVHDKPDNIGFLYVIKKDFHNCLKKY